MPRRIVGPALTAYVGIEMCVAVCDEIEPCHFMLVQIDRHCIDILLAKLVVHHRFKKASGAEVLGIPTRSRQRSGNCRRQHDIFGSAKHDWHLPRGSLVVGRSLCLLCVAWKCFFDDSPHKPWTKPAPLPT